MSESTTFAFNNIDGISMEVAKKQAPAIFATKPADYINQKLYKFTPTTEIIDYMKDMGYVLTGAKQSVTKVPLRRDYGTHIVTFQHPKLFVKDNNNGVEARPTIVLLNSHDGSRPIQFDMGLFRLICSNGLMVKSQDLGHFKERHAKYTFQQVKELIASKVETLPKVVEKINDWNGLEMTAKQRHKFAADALNLRVGEERQLQDYEILSVLEARRKEDGQPTLWTVFNTIQENLIKGGFMLNNRTARGITNPVQDMKLNKDLWQLAEEYAS
jgi:hypothetical protein